MSDEVDRATPKSAWRSMTRALAHRNYRLFFVGQGVSMIGTWMTRIATGWLVFRLSGSDSAFLLGLVGGFLSLLLGFLGLCQKLFSPVFAAHDCPQSV